MIAQGAAKNDELLSIEIPLPSLSKLKRMSVVEQARKEIEVQLQVINTLLRAIGKAFNEKFVAL
ncbi:MAG: hypothetical protein NNA23_08365 [Nitrospira sp.]|nr:hypothetical protein [Nitrospira sp.]